MNCRIGGIATGVALAAVSALMPRAAVHAADDGLLWTIPTAGVRALPSYARVVPLAHVQSHGMTVVETDATHRADFALRMAQRQQPTLVQPNYQYRALFVPNDPSYQFQWNLSADNVPAAWDYDTTSPSYGGDPSIIVAVLDTGVSYEDYGSYRKAPDFSHTAFAAGYDFVNNDAHPNDDNGHGTHVAMTIAESTNNALGEAGIAFNSTILPIKVLAADGTGNTATIAAGIDYARTHGASVINLSLGGTEDDPILHAAVQAATAAGIIVVAATGNDGVSSLYYPARYDETIAVGATRFDGSRALYANYGTGIDIVAPGGQLFTDQHYTTSPSDITPLDQNGDGQPDGILQETCTSSACSDFDDFYYEGTSQAAPQVSATIALLRAAGVDASRIASVIENSATDRGPAGYDTTYGWGQLNTEAALRLGMNDTMPPQGFVTINAGNQFSRSAQVTVTNSVTDTGTGVSMMSYSNDNTHFSSWESFASSKSWNLVSGNGAVDSDGVKTVYARFRDPAGNVSAIVTASITLDRQAPSTPVIVAHAPAPNTAVMIPSGRPTAVTHPDVEWSSSADSLSGIVGYKVIASTGTHADFSGIPLSPVSTRSLSAQSSVQYVYVVAVDAAGNESSIATFTYVYQPTSVAIGYAGRGSTVAVVSLRGKRLSTWQPFGTAFRSAITVASPVVSLKKSQQIAAGSTSGRSTVRVRSSTGGIQYQWYPYGTAAVPISVTAVDTTGDGIDELVVTPLRGAYPLRIFSLSGIRLKEWYPYGTGFTGGMTVAEAHAGNQHVLVIAAADMTTQLKMYSFAGKLQHQWYGYSSAAHFGLSVATGDCNGDGNDEILIGPYAGAPQVKIFSFSRKLLGQFFAFDKHESGGIVLGTGDYDGTGKDAIIASPAHGTARLAIFTMAGKRIRTVPLPTLTSTSSLSMTVLR